MTSLKNNLLLVVCCLVFGTDTQTVLAENFSCKISLGLLADRSLGVCLNIRGGENEEENTSTLVNVGKTDPNDVIDNTSSDFIESQASIENDNDIQLENNSVDVDSKAESNSDEKMMKSDNENTSIDNLTSNSKKTKPFIRETIQRVQTVGLEKMKANFGDLKKKHSDFHKRILSNESMNNFHTNYVGFQSKVNYAFGKVMKLGKRVLASLLVVFSTVLYTILPYFSKQNQPMTNLALLVLTLLGSSLGFFSFLYFISVGYGVGVALPASYALIAFNHPSSSLDIPILTNLHTGLVFIWGVRLALFLLHREFVNWREWNAKVKEVDQRSKITSKFSVWMSCAFFYATLLLPCLYRMRQAINPVHGIATTDSIAATAAIAAEESDLNVIWGDWGKTGIILQIVGLLIESIADYQKATFKASFTISSNNNMNATSNRNKWCNEGLWKYFTHPNYLGDAMFWIGTYLAGLGAMETTMQYILSTMGMLGIFIVLMGATEQLDKKQWVQYRKNPKYVEYVNNIGFMGPKFNKSKKAMKGNKKVKAKV